MFTTFFILFSSTCLDCFSLFFFTEHCWINWINWNQFQTGSAKHPHGILDLRASSILDFREHQVWKIVRPMREQPSNYEMKKCLTKKNNRCIDSDCSCGHYHQNSEGFHLQTYNPPAAHLLLQMAYVLPSKKRHQTEAVHT